jgi:hypothetical protein
MLRDKVAEDAPERGGSARSGERRVADEDFAVDGVDVRDCDLRRAERTAEFCESSCRPLCIRAALVWSEVAFEGRCGGDAARRTRFG